MSLDQAYNLLGFDSCSVPNEKEILIRYREMILKYHPDKRGPEGSEISSRLNQAKEMVRLYVHTQMHPEINCAHTQMQTHFAEQSQTLHISISCKVA